LPHDHASIERILAGTQAAPHRIGQEPDRLDRPQSININGGDKMNWETIEGKWKQVKGQAKEKWGKLTDDELDQIDGKREQLIGKVQEKYAIAREKAEEEVKEFQSTFRD
jgi:uncharacterized protein YjbJ (UPF0337 family)